MTTNTTVGAIHRIARWVDAEGPPLSLGRLRMKVLPLLLAEGLNFATIDENTDANPACVQAVREAATEIVGKPCPH